MVGAGVGVVGGWCWGGGIGGGGVGLVGWEVQWGWWWDGGNLMKNLKYEHKNIFPCWEGPNLILGIGKENQIFFLRTPAAVKFFNQILKK